MVFFFFWIINLLAFLLWIFLGVRLSPPGPANGVFDVTPANNIPIVSEMRVYALTYPIKFPSTPANQTIFAGVECTPANFVHKLYDLTGTKKIYSIICWSSFLIFVKCSGKSIFTGFKYWTTGGDTTVKFAQKREVERRTSPKKSRTSPKIVVHFVLP